MHGTHTTASADNESRQKAKKEEPVRAGTFPGTGSNESPADAGRQGQATTMPWYQKRESRVGLVAVLSFAILVSALIYRQSYRKSGDPATNARSMDTKEKKKAVPGPSRS